MWILGQVDDNNVRKSMLDLGLLEKASSNVAGNKTFCLCIFLEVQKL